MTPTPPRLRTLSVALALLVLGGCAAFRPEPRLVAQSEYFLGQHAYGDAVDRSLRVLEIDAQHRRAQALVREAYTPYVSQTRRAIDEREPGTAAAAATQRDYEAWGRLNERLARLPTTVVQIVDVTAQIADANQSVYDHADSLASAGGRPNLIEAALLFRQIDAFADAQARYLETREQATYRVLVLVTADPALTQRYEAFHQGVAAAAIGSVEGDRALLAAEAFEFVRLIPLLQEPAEDEPADEIVRLHLTALSMPRPESQTEDQTFETEVETGTREVDGRVERTFAKVSARARVTVRTTETPLESTLTIERAGSPPDASPLLVTGQIVERWATGVSGDRRAVQGYPLKAPERAPSPSERLADVVQDLGGALRARLESVVRREAR